MRDGFLWAVVELLEEVWERDVVEETESLRRELGYSLSGDGRRVVGRGDAERECAEESEEVLELTAEEGRVGVWISIICGLTRVNEITLAVTS